VILLWAIGGHRILAAFVFAVYLLIAIRFWYVALPVLALVIALKALGTRFRKRRAESYAASRVAQDG
jgi:membrane protein implicated in regulation of membrane protease activity